MSGASWRFTDADGVERTVSTDELRAALAGGKIPPSTLVWREGMGEWQAAFTLPELSSAAIAAARRGSIPPGRDGAKRSVPPPLPARSAPRGVYRTLTGIEPPAILEALGLNKRTAEGSDPGGTMLDAPTTDASEESAPETRQLGSLGDSDDWDNPTDMIPRAPGLPKDLRPLGLRPAPPAPASDPTHGSEPKRTTLLGFGQKPSIGKVPSAQGPAIRAIAVGRGSIPPAGGSASALTSPRSKPPPPMATPTSPTAVKKRSEPPPPPKRLNRTLEMAAAPAAAVVPGASAPKPGPPNRPPSRVGRITVQGGAGAPQSEMRTTRPMSKHPPPPLKAKPLPAVDLTPAAPAATATPLPATASPTISDEATKASPEVAAAALKASVAAATKEQRGSSPDGPTAISTLSVAPTTQNSANAVPAEKPAEKPAAKSSLSRETTEIIVREFEPISDVRRRAPERTIEMELGDHSNAAAKDPAPPESVKPTRSTTDRPPPETLIGKSPRGKGSATSKKRGETTDSTASRDARDSEVPSPRRKRRKSALEVPMSAVLAVSSVWVIGLVAFFFVGRVSGFKSAGKIPIANQGLSEAFLLKAAGPAAAPVVAVDNEPKPCWVTRQPSRWAPSASKTVSFDMRPHETSILLGFAVDDKKAAGLKIEPKTGKFEEIFKKETTEPIVRVSPRAGGTDFYVGEKADRTYLPVDAPAPFFMSFEKGMIGSVDSPEGSVEPLWTLEGDEPVTAEQVLPVTDGYALAFRRGNDVSLGLFGADRKIKGEIAKLDSKGKNGKPRIGTNGTELAATFAVKADDLDDTPWKLHIARAPIGTNPAVVELELAPGGPGGDAIAPDIIGLKDGRWLLMWTEGKSGERAIRAQTYEASFEPIGDPIALSPPAGSFGQALLGVVGTYTTVVFLQAADDGFEMWGAVLQCGS